MTTILFFLSLSLFAQKNFFGRYRDYFGDRIELNADSTFEDTWRFDIASSWTKGKWSLKNDTLYFQMIATYDTISYKNNDGTSPDKLILSVDKTPERLTPEQYAGMELPLGGQNFQNCPKKLFFKKERLYKIYKGKLIVKKQKGFSIKKKWNPWFFKSTNENLRLAGCVSAIDCLC